MTPDPHRRRAAWAALVLGVAALAWAGWIQIRSAEALDDTGDRARALAGQVAAACDRSTAVAATLGPACDDAADVRALPDPDPDGSGARRPTVCIAPAATPTTTTTTTGG